MRNLLVFKPQMKAIRIFQDPASCLPSRNPGCSNRCFLRRNVAVHRPWHRCWRQTRPSYTAPASSAPARSCCQAPQSLSRMCPRLSWRWWSAAPPRYCCQAPQSWSRTCPRLTQRWWRASPPLSYNQATRRCPCLLNGGSEQNEII